MNNRFESNIGNSLQDQLASLADEVASMRKSIRKQSRHAYRDARHAGEDAGEWLRNQAAHAMPEIRRGAHQIQKAARDNPAATIGVATASLFVIGMAIAFMARR